MRVGHRSGLTCVTSGGLARYTSESASRWRCFRTTNLPDSDQPFHMPPARRRSEARRRRAMRQAAVGGCGGLARAEPAGRRSGAWSDFAVPYLRAGRACSPCTTFRRGWWRWHHAAQRRKAGTRCGSDLGLATMVSRPGESDARGDRAVPAASGAGWWRCRRRRRAGCGRLQLTVEKPYFLFVGTLTAQESGDAVEAWRKVRRDHAVGLVVGAAGVPTLPTWR